MNILIALLLSVGAAMIVYMAFHHYGLVRSTPAPKTSALPADTVSRPAVAKEPKPPAHEKKSPPRDESPAKIPEHDDKQKEESSEPLRPIWSIHDMRGGRIIPDGAPPADGSAEEKKSDGDVIKPVPAPVMEEFSLFPDEELSLFGGDMSEKYPNHPQNESEPGNVPDSSPPVPAKKPEMPKQPEVQFENLIIYRSEPSPPAKPAPVSPPPAARDAQPAVETSGPTIAAETAALGMEAMARLAALKKKKQEQAARARMVEAMKGIGGQQDESQTGHDAIP